MSILFINGSPNKTGNTAALAATLLRGKDYKTLNLTDYTIGAYGQNLPGDGLDAVIAAMKQADTIVIGSPRILAQHLRQRPQCAGPFLRESGRERLERADPLLRLPGRSAGTLDAGGR